MYSDAIAIASLAADRCAWRKFARLCRLRGARAIALLLLSLIHFRWSYLLLSLNCGTTVTLCSDLCKFLYYCSPKVSKKSYIKLPSKFQTTKPGLQSPEHKLKTGCHVYESHIYIFFSLNHTRFFQM